ncbi:metallophosphoesterase family protein [Anaerobacillus sp. MEB173]|uniref:metallophosphoesterase family protein n=1 Tax=Anaerobacillus sp. MEB173 TaxID=3383345 RepID=UPI003F8F8223
MKVLIISDSHGWQKEVEEVILRHRSEVNTVIHCGDSELQNGSKELTNVLVVKGNCDRRNSGFPEEILHELNGLKLYITHGHLYNVKMSHVPISYRGEEVGANIVCFGHSHLAVSFKENGIIYINPGSLRLPRGRNEQTYVICELETSKVTVRFYERSGKEIEELKKEYEIIEN